MQKQEIDEQLHDAGRDVVFVKDIQAEKAKEDAEDETSWFKKTLGFVPFKYQQDLIDKFKGGQFIAARWCRQSGKSWIVSALLLNYAVTHDDSYIAVVGPSWRQTKLNIRRMSFFLRKLSQHQCLKPGRTILRFTNGSVIEAFPNNPDTIRGPTLQVVWWDEVNFTPNDADLYDAILFTLGTTDGKLIATSTPWNADSIFWKMCFHKD